MKKDIINRIIEKLPEYKNEEIYASDLAYTIFERENIDGTFTYSTYEAKEWIKKYYDEIGEVWEELNFQFGSEFLVKFNAFENPEKFMVLIILESASYILGKCKLLENNWNKKIKLNNKNIAILEKQLKELDNDGNIYE